MNSINITTDEFTNSSIKITDYNDYFKVYHYTDNKNINSENDVRGIIRDINSNIVCKTFSYTPEYFSDDKDTIKELFKNTQLSLSNNYKFYRAEEVTLIRLWYHNHRWRLSTHKKLDAYTSRWGSYSTYGELFEEAIEYSVKQGELHDKIQYEDEDHIMDCFLYSLRTDRIYAFILRTNENNRIVCDPSDSPEIYFAGEFDSKTFNYIDANTSGISRPTELFFSNIEYLLTYLDNVDPMKYQGVMVYKFDDKHNLVQTIKLTNIKYQELFSIRGNCPSVPFRYLQVRNDPEKVHKLIDLYPEYREDFMTYENIISDIINNIHTGYIRRYINKQYTILPKEQFFIMDDLHKMYLQDKQTNKISVDLISQYINNIPTITLNNLIHSHIPY
jgi:hypothetical protein